MTLLIVLLLLALLFGGGAVIKGIGWLFILALVLLLAAGISGSRVPR